MRAALVASPKFWPNIAAAPARPADQIIVPLVTRGPLDNLKTEIDPDFDLAGAAFEAGFRGLLNEVLKDEGIPLGDILEGIFGGKKKRR